MVYLGALNDMVYLDFCVALGKVGTFSSSPRAEFLSFDFHYDVYPKATISDKKEWDRPTGGVRCCTAQYPFFLSIKLGQGKVPMKWCLVPVFLRVLQVIKRQSVLVVHKPAKICGEIFCFGGWLILLPAWCPQCFPLSSLWRRPREETWLGMANMKPLVLCWRNISLWLGAEVATWCHLLQCFSAAGPALLPVPSTVQGSPKAWGWGILMSVRWSVSTNSGALYR